MFNIVSHKGNADQNYFEVPSHPSQIGFHQEHKPQQMLVKMWGEGTLIHYW
jgi:hypothetical protein